MAETYLSRAGYERLAAELEALKLRKAELSREIGEAAEKGDLSENAEYHAAKERQAETLRRIHELDGKLKSARILEEIKVQAGTVQIGTRVTILDVEDREEFTWTLVGPDEADPPGGKISVYSPLAQGLLGAKEGAEVMVNVPAGARKFKVIKAEPAI